MRIVKVFCENNCEGNWSILSKFWKYEDCQKSNLHPFLEKYKKLYKNYEKMYLLVGDRNYFST